MGEGRVVDKYMDGTVPFRHPPEGLADGLGLSQVGLDEANTVRQGFVLFHVESRDRIPRALEAFAKVKPYAACAARDDAYPHAAPRYAETASAFFMFFCGSCANTIAQNIKAHPSFPAWSVAGPA